MSSNVFWCGLVFGNNDFHIKALLSFHMTLARCNLMSSEVKGQYNNFAIYMLTPNKWVSLDSPVSVCFFAPDVKIL